MTQKWEKPELIVLLRGKPEEVLTSDCKIVSANPYPGHPDVNSGGCGKGSTANCGACQARSGGS